MNCWIWLYLYLKKYVGMATSQKQIVNQCKFNSEKYQCNGYITSFSTNNC